MKEFVPILIKTLAPFGVAFLGYLFSLIFKQFKSIKKLKLFNEVSKLMQRAEDLFTKGVDKKEWVISQCKTLGFNEKMISDIIERLIEFSKNINKGE